MDHLEDITLDELQQALAEVDRKKPTQRLLAAIAYKNGVTQTELARWYGVERRTIYNWLKRLEHEPLAAAVIDDRRPGRPRKLTEEQRSALAETLRETPSEAGYDAQSWTPTLVRRHVSETFGVEYSHSSCRRLLRETAFE